MNQLPYVVVGAGPTGLGCATALADHRPVVIFDRLPVTGGTAGWDAPEVVRFTRAAHAAGARPRLGLTALRWDGTSLLVAGPGTFERIEARHLFFAGGLRPASAADLGVEGDRAAGVLPATVAEHLLDSGVKLWHTAAILGDGPWARTIAQQCHRLGTRVIAIGTPDPEQPPGWADQRYSWPCGLGVVGRDRVTGLRLRTAAGQVHIHCDAVILAADPRPNRNVVGALLDAAVGVTYLQPPRPHLALDRHDAGHDATRAWLETNGDRP